MVGMYKLEMKFQNGETKFITKVALANHGPYNAAVIMDHGLDYFVEVANC